MKEQIEGIYKVLVTDCGMPCPECDYEGDDLCVAHRKAEALYNAGYRKQEWISVEDRLPEVRQRVLLYSYHDGINTGYRADEIGRFYVDKSYPYRPTYWMPLPEPPKMKGGAE